MPQGTSMSNVKHRSSVAFAIWELMTHADSSQQTQNDAIMSLDLQPKELK